MGKYLDIARGVSRPTDTPANEHQNRRAGPPLEARLDRLGIRLAIDKNTGEAYLVFSESDTEAARSVAWVYKPFEVRLTDSQKIELLADLKYYERLIKRKAAQR